MIRLIIFDWGRTLYDNKGGRLFPETIDLLQNLSKKYKLAIVSLVTDGDFEKRRKILRENNLNQYFSSILFTQTDKDELYDRTLSNLNVEPRNVVIVDDRVIRGVKWGNKRGTKTIWLKNGKFSDDLPTEETGQPTNTITNLKDLQKILESYNN